VSLRGGEARIDFHVLHVIIRRLGPSEGQHKLNSTTLNKTVGPLAPEAEPSGVLLSRQRRLIFSELRDPGVQFFTVLLRVEG
jgi:hypothetical protein